jgi:hypothetical protein
LQVVLPISRWSAWPSDDAAGRAAASAAGSPSVPEVKFVDPMLRRRLGPLAKALLHVAHECAGDRASVRLVLASQHGDVAGTLGMLRALAADEPVSPTVFSLSVHNAAAGIFSILRRDRAPSTAIAAGEETLGHGLLEAFCQLDEGGEAVLMIYADSPLPAEYQPYAERPASARALGVLLEHGATRRLALEAAPAAGAQASPGPQADAFFAHLAHGGAGSWTGAQRSWSWH